MSQSLGSEAAPPSYKESTRPMPTSSLVVARTDLHQPAPNNAGYTPVQYNLAGQDPQGFYGALIDAFNFPSEIFCRMADALFFHLDQHCNQFCGTQQIEPAKLAWLGVVLGQDTELSMAVQQHLPSLYDAASIPYTFNSTRIPVLDRRGHLHLCVFEACAGPAHARQQWNKTLNVLKLRDPLTNLPFPTPVPRSAFPSAPNFLLKRVYTKWQVRAALDVSRQTSQAIPAQTESETPRSNALHNSLTAQVQQAVPIARRAAFQTVQQFERLQKIQAAKSRSMQPEISQNAQASDTQADVASELSRRRLEEVDKKRKVARVRANLMSGAMGGGSGVGQGGFGNYV